MRLPFEGFFIMAYTPEELNKMSPTELRTVGKELGLVKKSNQSWRDFIEVILNYYNKASKGLLEITDTVIIESSDNLENPAQSFNLKYTKPEFYEKNNILFCKTCQDIIAHDLKGKKVCKRGDCPN